MKTLLTGFGPFGDVASNPTERLVRYFQRLEVPGHRLTTRVLPVSYEAAPAMLIGEIDRAASDGEPFDLIWMLGVAAGSPNWRVERCGRNFNEAAADMDGLLPPSQIVSDGPDILEANVPVETLVDDLATGGLPVTASDTAGAYLCNHVLYRALWHLRGKSYHARVGFLHVPSDHETYSTERAGPATFSFEQHVQAVGITLARLGTRN